MGPGQLSRGREADQVQELLGSVRETAAAVFCGRPAAEGEV
jgi:hypothetical protein